MKVNVSFDHVTNYFNISLKCHDEKIDIIFNDNYNKIFNVVFSYYQEKTVIKDAEHYDGSYTITPSIDLQTLYTSHKMMTDNVIINEIPCYITSNQFQGETVYIGTEVDIHGG